MAESDACCVVQVLDHHRCGATAPGAANARLIAAAPRMYEALRNLTALNECWCSTHGPVRVCFRCEARAVLTEIEGKSNVKA